MSDAGRVELSVLGQTLTVRTSADPAYLRSLAAYLEERVTALRNSGVRDGHTALLMAALDIADELFRARQDKERGDQTVGERIGALIALLDNVTPSERPR